MLNYSSYRKHFSESKLHSKLFSLPRQARDQLLQQLLILWVLVVDSETPKTAKLLLAGVLGYVILVVDLCPDFVPIAGLIDDIAAVGCALSYAQFLVTERIEGLASRKLTSWAGKWA